MISIPGGGLRSENKRRLATAGYAALLMTALKLLSLGRGLGLLLS
jgi:hypothetical protein